jgi:hypothetical protein
MWVSSRPTPLNSVSVSAECFISDICKCYLGAYSKSRCWSKGKFKFNGKLCIFIRHTHNHFPWSLPLSTIADIPTVQKNLLYLRPKVNIKMFSRLLRKNQWCNRILTNKWKHSWYEGYNRLRLKISTVNLHKLLLCNSRFATMFEGTGGVSIN